MCPLSEVIELANVGEENPAVVRLSFSQCNADWFVSIYH